MAKIESDLVMSFWGKTFTNSGTGEQFTKFTVMDKEGYIWEIRYNQKKQDLIAGGATDQDTKADFFLTKSQQPKERKGQTGATRPAVSLPPAQERAVSSTAKPAYGKVTTPF